MTEEEVLSVSRILDIEEAGVHLGRINTGLIVARIKGNTAMKKANLAKLALEFARLKKECGFSSLSYYDMLEIGLENERNKTVDF